MPRKPRIEFPGALYHVIARGNNRQGIFVEAEDYKHFLFRLKQAKERFKFTLYAYALMPNHFHLLIETGETPLSKVMQSLQLNYTQHFNRKFKRIGHLFQGRYKAILCQKENYLLELIRYIILNPIRAQLAKSLNGWLWSSYSEIGLRKDLQISSVDDVLSFFGQKNKAALSSFSKFINDGKPDGHKKEYYSLKDQRILGEETFAEDVIKNTADDFEYRKITIDEIVDIVAKHINVGREKITSTTSERCGAKGRGIVAFICKNIGGFKAKKISAYFKRAESTISKSIKQAETGIANNGLQKKLIANIEQEIKTHYSPCIVRQIE